MPTAILVDGGFFIKRYRSIYDFNSPEKVAKDLYEMCLRHLSPKTTNKDKQSNSDNSSRNLYRIFFYDCPPLNKKVHHPITNQPIDYQKSKEAIFRNQLHQELRKLRKVALRLGYISESGHWVINPTKTRELLKKKLFIDELNDVDIIYEVRQKGVDMKIGLDIASLAYKKLASQIILIAGDSDFVPAAKLARREGVDFILDPMWNPIKPDLHEHIDGLRSTCPNPTKK